jgi:hypothetical protein
VQGIIVIIYLSLSIYIYIYIFNESAISHTKISSTQSHDTNKHNKQHIHSSKWSDGLLPCGIHSILIYVNLG